MDKVQKGILPIHRARVEGINLVHKLADLLRSIALFAVENTNFIMVTTVDCACDHIKASLWINDRLNGCPSSDSCIMQYTHSRNTLFVGTGSGFQLVTTGETETHAN